MTTVKNRYKTRAMLIMLPIGLFSVVIGRKDICKGLLMGTFFSIFNFTMMSFFLHRRIDINNTKSKAILTAMIGVIIRYILMALPLLIAIKHNLIFNTIGTVFGLFAVQLAILVDYVPKILPLPKWK